MKTFYLVASMRQLFESGISAAAPVQFDPVSNVLDILEDTKNCVEWIFQSSEEWAADRASQCHTHNKLFPIELHSSDLLNYNNTERKIYPSLRAIRQICPHEVRIEADNFIKHLINS